MQEESQNMGGWTFMEPRLRAMGFAVEYVGRDASASPATGSLQVHKREQEELVEAAIAARRRIWSGRRAEPPPPDGAERGRGGAARGTRGRAGSK